MTTQLGYELIASPASTERPPISALTQSDSRQLNRHGLVLLGQTLTIPEPTRGIVEETDGTRRYVVKRRHTIRGIATDTRKVRPVMSIRRSPSARCNAPGTRQLPLVLAAQVSSR